MVKTQKRTPEIEQFIRDNYLTVPIRHIAKKFRISRTPIKNFMKREGLVLPDEIKKQRQNYYQPGNVPPNKGKKGYCIPGSEKGWFKKGHLPHNTRKEGDVFSVRVSKGYPMLYYRLSISNWVIYARYVWEQKHGAIPPKHVIWHKDGNPLNCSIDNLECISCKENRIRTSASTTLHDSYILNMLARKDKDLAKHIIESNKELIDLKRNQILISKSLKEFEINEQ